MNANLFYNPILHYDLIQHYFVAQIVVAFMPLIILFITLYGIGLSFQFVPRFINYCCIANFPKT